MTNALHNRIAKLERAIKAPAGGTAPDLSALTAEELFRLDAIAERCQQRQPLTDEELAFVDAMEAKVVWTDGPVLSADQQRAAMRAFYRADR
ncbi:hypothetical protein [Azospirillum melinis]